MEMLQSLAVLMFWDLEKKAGPLLAVTSYLESNGLRLRPSCSLVTGSVGRPSLIHSKPLQPEKEHGAYHLIQLLSLEDAFFEVLISVIPERRN